MILCEDLTVGKAGNYIGRSLSDSIFESDRRNGQGS
jgi:hypothetical protein